MKSITQHFAAWIAVGILVLATASFAQEKPEASMTKFAAGQKAKISGVIVQRAADSFVVRDAHGANAVIKLTSATLIKEKKSNPFRGALNYAPAQLVRGLSVEVEGLGDANGALAARDVKFTKTEFMAANSVESRVTPVEGRLDETEGRLAQSEENARHLSGQVDEVKEISTAARGEAKAAQDTADRAIEGVKDANDRIAAVDQSANARIAAVDDYQVKGTVVVHFKVGSSVLSDDAKAQLDQLVKNAQAQKGYVVEVTGFASSDGNADFNRTLSQRRADGVVQYLADNLIPLRRIITPFGFGTKMPVADNSTHAGREDNRRVEVKILTSKGLAGGQSEGLASIKNR